MKLTRVKMLEASRARDRAYDGAFLTGVLSTGIYCLPSCPARAPREEHVRFFSTPEEARAAGLRPCLRCRPDDFLQGRDPEAELAAGLAERVRRDPARFPDVGALGREAGLGATALNVLFRRQFHAAPAAFLQRARVAAACRALVETDRKIIEIALGVGYESLSAFHDNFRRATGLCPGDYRRLRAAAEFTLALPRDFQANLTLAHLCRDPESPTERRQGRTMVRAIRAGGVPVLLRLELRAGAAHCSVETGRGLGPGAMVQAHEAVLRLLGLLIEPGPFERRLGRSSELGRLVRGRRGLRIPQTADVFEGLTWAVVGQQVGLPFAFRLRRRLVERCGSPVAGGLSTHPGPEAVARLDYADLTRKQFSRQKAEYLIDAARGVVAGDLPLEGLAAAPAATAERRLLAVRGLGPWAAGYLMMRSCAFVDALPAGDSGLARALQGFFRLAERPGREEMERRMAPFAPFRGLATFHLWSELGAAA